MARGGGTASTTTTSGNTKRTFTHHPTKHKLHHHHSRRRRRNTLSHLLPYLTTATSAAHAFLTQNDLRLLPSQTLALESRLSTLLSLIHQIPTQPPSPPPPPPPPPPSSWFHRFLSATSASDDSYRLWLETFRMSKASFTLLLRTLSPFLHHSLPSLPPNIALAAAIYRLAHAAPYAFIATRFGMDPATACRAFYLVCKVINDRLSHLFEFRSDINRIVVGFGWISLPNCCGVLGLGKFEFDGKLLGVDGALMVQALVDSEGRFLDVSAGWPSSMTPDTILRQTKLFLGVEESRELLNGPSFNPSEGVSIPQYILGDACFPLLPWLLTPFVPSSEEDSLSSSEQAFNAAHSRGMGLVGTAFGRVKGRWRLLSRRWKEECIEFFPFVVVAGCLLHNFLIKCSEPLPDGNVEQWRDREGGLVNGEASESGKRTRETLASQLSRVNLRI